MVASLIASDVGSRFPRYLPATRACPICGMDEFVVMEVISGAEYFQAIKTGAEEQSGCLKFKF